MTRITAYRFGHLRIDNKSYTSDLIIYPDGTVRDEWWRRRGHHLAASDIMALIDAGPEMLIVGTGASGLLRPEPELCDLLTARGIELLARPTAEAITSYNDLAADHRVGACFHLTC